MMRKKETRPGAPTSERVKDPGQASMIRRALEIVRTVRALDGTLQEMGGQTAFDLS